MIFRLTLKSVRKYCEYSMPKIVYCSFPLAGEKKACSTASIRLPAVSALNRMFVAFPPRFLRWLL